MKPEPYLTKEGKVIFKRLVDMLKTKLEPVDVFQLSQLADSIALNQAAAQEINFPTDKKIKSKHGVQMSPNGYTTISGYVMVKDKTQRLIDQLSSRFGLTPGDREKLRLQTEKEVSPLEKFKPK